MSDVRKKHIYFLGVDAYNWAQLKALRQAQRFEYHELLTMEEIKGAGRYPVLEALELAEKRLGEQESSVDAIVTFWDFPATLLHAILTTRFGRPGPSLESTLKCEHKFWSRLEQSKVVPGNIPGFRSVDTGREQTAEDLGLRFPFWLKPVKGTDSILAFKIESEYELQRALRLIRQKSDHLGQAFDKILQMAEVPDEVKDIGGHHCIAEESLEGNQYTVTGYVHSGRVVIYGVVDSLNYPGTSSFFSYQYPSALDEVVQRDMCVISEKLIRQVGLQETGFNIEFFHDPDTGDLKVLEINPRISQSHSDIFRKVDGDSDEEIVIQLGLGEDPEFPHREGEFPFAAKFYHRTFQDGIVRHVPTAEELDALRREHPEAIIDLVAKREGQRLSEMLEQDAYSFDLAHIFVGASKRDELRQKYDSISSKLRFLIEPKPELPEDPTAPEGGAECRAAG